MNPKSSNMKEIKTKFIHEMIRTNGSIDEYSIGENVGLCSEETEKILSVLLLEYKITYCSYRSCDYKVITNKKK